MKTVMRAEREPWSIFDDLFSLQEEFNRIFDAGSGHWSRGRYPAMNVWETDTAVVVDAELPGVDPANVELSVEGNELTLRGQIGQPDDKTEYLTKEIGHGRFERTVRLPYRVNSQAVKAVCRHGILRIELPRADEDKPRKIAVQVG